MDEKRKNPSKYLLNIKINHWLRVSEVFDHPQVNSGVTGDAGERERGQSVGGWLGRKKKEKTAAM